MAMMKNEMEILRAVSAKLDPETLFVVTYQYHTEKDPSDPEGKRTCKEKSRYRMLGRIEKIKDLEAKMIELGRDENRLKPWKWPDDPSWDGKILYAKDASAAGRSNWIRLKIRKAISWENLLLSMQGYKKDTDKNSPDFGKFTVRNPSSACSTKGWTCSNGDVIDIDDKQALLAHTGQNVWMEIKMKQAGSRAGK